MDGLHDLKLKFFLIKELFCDFSSSYGSRISATAGYVYVLRPNAEMWTRALLRRTQIIYTPDCALILMLLDVRPGSVSFRTFICFFFCCFVDGTVMLIYYQKLQIVCECGTGSGSLSHALAMAIAPTGHLYTHDIEEQRVKQVELEMVVSIIITYLVIFSP